MESDVPVCCGRFVRLRCADADGATMESATANAAAEMTTFLNTRPPGHRKLMLSGGREGSYDAEWFSICAKDSKRLRCAGLGRLCGDVRHPLLSRELDTTVSSLSLSWDARRAGG